MLTNKKRVIYSLWVLGLFVLTMIISPSIYGQSKILEKQSFSMNTVDSYFDDFTTTTYRDGSSTVSGWGMNGVMNTRNYSWEQLDFHPTEYPAYSLAVQGRKAYVSCHNSTTSNFSLQAFDINDPRNIRRMSYRNSVTHSYTSEVDGDFLFLGTSDGTFDSYNIQDPFNLNGGGVFLDWYETDGPVTDVDIEGHLVYYTVYNSTSSRSLGMSYAEDPSALDSIACSWSSNKGLGLDVEGDLAYIAASDAGFYVVNITDKYVTPEIGHIDTPGNATDVLIDGNLAFVADGDGGVQIISVQDPTNPVILGSYNTPDNARRMILQENTLLVADESGGIQVLDVTNPNHPLFLTELLTSEIVYDVDLMGGILVATTNKGIHTFRIAANWGMADIAETAFPNPFDLYNVYDVRVQGNVAYIVGGTDGFYTVDVSNPAAPVFLDNITTGMNLRKLDVEGQFAYAVAFNGWQIFDISDPANLRLIRTFAGGGMTDVDIEGEVLYLSFTTGVALINVSNPFIPTVIINNYISGIHMNNTAINVDGRQIYMVEGVGSSSDSFTSYLGTDFTSLTLTDSLTRTVPMYDVHVDGDCAYLGAGGWMALHNVSNPYSITYPDYVTTTSWGVWSFGTNVLSAELANGVALYNTSNVFNITPIGRYPNATGALQITTNGDYTYIANQSSLIILRHHYSAASTFMPGTAIAQSTEIDGTNLDITKATLNVDAFVQTETTVVFYMSVDGGAHWEIVTPGVEHIFTNPGDDLRWRIEITGPDYRSAYIYSVDIDFYFNEYPTQPILHSIGDVFDNESVLVSWNASIDDGIVDHYILQMCNSSDFLSLTDSWNVSSEEKLLTDLAVGIFYFRVRAVDQYEFISPWSNVVAVNVTAASTTSQPPGLSPLWLGIIIGGSALVLITIIVVVVVVVVRSKKTVTTR